MQNARGVSVKILIGSLLLGAFGAVAAACGGSEQDAGCEFTTSLNDFTAPDAALGDSGTTASACLDCTKANCKSNLDECDNNCECRGAGIQFYTCIGKGKAPLNCLSSFGGVSSEVQTIGTGLLTCVNAACNTQCAVPSFDAGALDGSSDARRD
jgi:hypothetical protein